MRTDNVSFVFLRCYPSTGAAQEQPIHCVSEDGGTRNCPVDTKQGASLVKQRGETHCNQEKSWGSDDKGIWVDHGCSGDFAPGPATTGGRWEKIVTCTSDGGKKYCDANTHHGVKLVKQHGDAPCKEGRRGATTGWGFGWTRDAARTLRWAERRNRQRRDPSDEAKAKEAEDKTCLKEVGKARSDQMVKQCLQVSPATHPPCNAQNSCELITDEIRRSCQLLGQDGPGFCSGYLK